MARLGRRDVPGLPAPTGPGDALVRANECRVPHDAPLPPAWSLDGVGEASPESLSTWQMRSAGGRCPSSSADHPLRGQHLGHPAPRVAGGAPVRAVDIAAVVAALDRAFRPSRLDGRGGRRAHPSTPAWFDVRYVIDPDLDPPAGDGRDRGLEWLLPRAGADPAERRGHVARRTGCSSSRPGRALRAGSVGGGLAGCWLVREAMPMRTIW